MSAPHWESTNDLLPLLVDCVSPAIAWEIKQRLEMTELAKVNAIPVKASQRAITAPAQGDEYFEFRGFRWVVTSIHTTLHQRPLSATMQLECVSVGPPIFEPVK